MKPMLNLHRLGARVKEYRNAKGMTQEDLATAIGSYQEHISEIENGEHSNLRLFTLMRLAQALGCKLQDLMDQGPIIRRSLKRECQD